MSTMLTSAGRCLPPLTGHLGWEVVMSTMTEERYSGPVLPPGCSRRSFLGELRADAVVLVLGESHRVLCRFRLLSGWVHVGAEAFGEVSG